MAVINIIEAKLTRAVVTQEDGWYHVNAWARGTDREPWKQVWHSRISRSYLFSLNMANDTGSIKLAYQDTLNFSN